MTTTSTEPTRKVILRGVTGSDLSIIFQQQQDPESIYMAAFVSRDPSDRKAFDAHWSNILADPKVVARVITLDGKVAGWIGSWVDKEWLGEPEVTYWIGKEYWGRGVATAALLEFLRSERKRPIHARAAKDNHASLRVLEKCRFTLFGYGKGFANARNAEIEEAHLRLD